MTLFTDLKLDPKVLKAVQEAGYDTPTPIQKGAIPPALEGKDVLGIAQTGTGKTAGFTLPMITRLARGRARARMPRSLILCPTRELAAQVAENFDLYAKYTRLTKALLIGGVSFGEQDKLIDRGVDVLIATPGRLLDHFERGKLLLTGVEVMVVDEADRMLDMGFIPDIERIFQLTPFTRQTLFFSATMAPEIERITDTFLHSPARVEVARQATASETIEQRLVTLTPTRKDQTAKQKRQLLRAIIDAEGERLTNAIIFSNRKTDVDILTKSLRTHGYDAAAIHGDLNQSHRTRTLDDFREGRLRFLVASDVAARGLDIPEVSHVFNYDLPRHAEDYVHRIGRTGRAGRDGVAISIEEPLDEKYLAAIESLLKRSLPKSPAPEGFVPSEGGGRSGGRSRSRSGRGRGQERDRQDKDNGPARPEDVPPAKADASAGKEPARKPSRDSARSDHARHHEPAEGRSRDSTRRRDEPRATSEQRGNDRGRGSTIRGMGDHVPEFLTRSFLDSLAATERADAARQDQDDQLGTKADADKAQQGEARPDNGKRMAELEKAAPSEKPDIEAAATESPTDAAAADKDDSDAAKPRRTRTTRSRTASKPDEKPEEVKADESDKPKTTRRRSPSRTRAAQAADDIADADMTEPDSPPSGESGDTIATKAADATEDAKTEDAKEDAPKKPATRRRTSTRTRSTTAAKKPDTAQDAAADPDPEADSAKPAATRSRARSTVAKTPAKDASAEKPAARKAPAKKPVAKPAPKADAEASEQPPAPADNETKPAAKKPASRASTTRKTTTKAKADGESDADTAPKPARRTTSRSKKAATEAAEGGAEGGADNDKP